MSDDHHGSIIIVKKKISGGDGHHGGAWKIAFADFMTAMMAFFLVLWIINASDKDTKTVIARYFNPVKLESPARAKKGVHGTTNKKNEETSEEENKSADLEGKKQGSKGKEPINVKDQSHKDAKAQATAPIASKSLQDKESQLFSQPYETLDRIVGGAVGDAKSGSSDKTGDGDPQRLAGTLAVEAFRDPFKPIGAGAAESLAIFDADAHSESQQDIEPEKQNDKKKGKDDAALEKDKDLQDQGLGKQKKANIADEKLNEEESHSNDGKNKKSVMDSRGQTLGIDGVGEKNLQGPDDKLQGLGKNGLDPQGNKATLGNKDANDIKAGAFESLIKKAIASVLGSGQGPQIGVTHTQEGLLISLTDKLDFSMFAIGSSIPRAELVKAMAIIGKIVKTTSGHIVLRGHTDTRPYRKGTYDNWHLSSDRAQLAYYMLTRGGTQANRFVRIEGYADRSLKDPIHPLSAVNRRLEILIEEPHP